MHDEATLFEYMAYMAHVLPPNFLCHIIFSSRLSLGQIDPEPSGTTFFERLDCGLQFWFEAFLDVNLPADCAYPGLCALCTNRLICSQLLSLNAQSDCDDRGVRVRN